MVTPSQQAQRGFSLVELMIAITIGLVLMTGVVQMFLSSKTVFSTQQGISRIQETGRMAMEFMAKDIREAGYQGCMSRQVSNYFSVLSTPNSFLYDFETHIQAGEASSEGEIGGITLDPVPIAGSPVLAIRTANGAGVRVIQETTATSITVEDLGEIGGCPSGICANDILMITDCAKARVFQASAVASGTDVTIEHGTGGSPGNRFESWGGSDPTPDDIFRVGAEVIKVRTLLYYIADNARNRPSLYLQEGNIPGGAVELLEGVEAMNLEFGIGNASVVTDFVPFSAGINWNNVLAVRLSLLVQSTDDNVSPEPQTYTFAGEEPVTAEDRRIRQVFTTTVGIRSRLN